MKRILVIRQKKYPLWKKIVLLVRQTHWECFRCGISCVFVTQNLLFIADLSFLIGSYTLRQQKGL